MIKKKKLFLQNLTALKYIAAGKIKAQKIGNGWKVFKADLDRFVRGE